MKITNRQRRIAAEKELKKEITHFSEIDLSTVSFIPKGMTRAYRNTRYTVMVYDNSPTTKGGAIRVMVQNHTDTQIVMHWDELQKIKNQIFGPEAVAVEYYPAESQLINDHNIYWLWLFPDGSLPIPIL